MNKLKRIVLRLVLSFSLLISLPVFDAALFINQPIAIAATNKKTEVYITKTGKKYHKKKCGNGKFTKATLQKAKDLGLTKCKKCY